MIKSKLVKKQVKKINCTIKKSKLYPKFNGRKLHVEIRYDDECGNGHNSFTITGHVWNRRKTDYDICGCIHDFIIEQMPELEKYIKWHLTSSDEPLHYIANSLYHASERDCWGKLKGEPYNYKLSLKFDNFPLTFNLKQDFLKWLDKSKPTKLTIIELTHDKDPEMYSHNYTFKEYIESEGIKKCWYKNLFNNIKDITEMRDALLNNKYHLINKPTSWGKGKTPDLNAARSCALWFDAELSDFTEDNLKARHDKLMVEFRDAMVELGFEY